MPTWNFSAKPDAIVRLGKPGTTGLDQDQNLGQVGTREVKIGTRPARTGTKARINGTKLGRRRTGFRRFCVQSRNTPKEACGGFSADFHFLGHPCRTIKDFDEEWIDAEEVSVAESTECRVWSPVPGDGTLFFVSRLLG